MKITREIIQDMLPLYLADEVSADTRALIEKYLETNPELAKLALQQKEAMELPRGIPVPLTEETQKKAYKKSKMILSIIIVSLAVIIATVMGLIWMFLFVSG